MVEKFNLIELLKEIKEDEKEDFSTKKEKISQDEIQRLIDKRRQTKDAPTE